MYGLSHSRQVLHKECGKARMIRDNKDESTLFTVLSSLNVFMTKSNKDSLINIATKDVATDTIKNSLLQAYDLGKKQTDKF